MLSDNFCSLVVWHGCRQQILLGHSLLLGAQTKRQKTTHKKVSDWLIESTSDALLRSREQRVPAGRAARKFAAVHPAAGQSPAKRPPVPLAAAGQSPAKRPPVPLAAAGQSPAKRPPVPAPVKRESPPRKRGRKTFTYVCSN